MKTLYWIANTIVSTKCTFDNIYIFDDIKTDFPTHALRNI